MRAEPGIDSPLSAQQKRDTKSAFKAARVGRITRTRQLLRGDNRRLALKLAEWLYYTKSGAVPDFNKIARFVDANPNWPAQQNLRRAAETAMGKSVPTERVLEWFARHPPPNATARIRMAAAFFESGQPNLGEVLARQIWLNDNMRRAVEHDFYRRYRGLLTTEDHIARLDRLLWDRKRGAARRMLQRVPAEQRALALARISLIESAPGVDEAVARVPPGMIDHPGLVYERVYWRRTKGFHERARELLWEPPNQLGRAPPKWWHERRLQVRRLLRRGHVSEAYRMANSHRQTGRAEIAEAEWLAGWIALSFLEDAESALQHFTRGHGVVRYPISVARMAYWAGRAAHDSSKVELAEMWASTAAEHPATYYGQLALARHDRLVPFSLPRQPITTTSGTKGFRDSELVRAIRLLAALGEHKLLRHFLLHLSQLAETSEHHRLIGDLAASLDRIDLGVAAAKIAVRDGVLLPRSSYPIIGLPPHSGPEPALLLAVARQESEFNTRAISHAGARGLMQLMPATARLVARSIKVRYNHQRLIDDADYNAILGSAHLNDLIRDYRGSYVLALAAYNAGGGNVKRWLRAWGDPRDREVDVIDWIELIPIYETRNYIQRVLENVQVYRYRLAGGTVPLDIVDDLNGGLCGGRTGVSC